MKSLIKWIAVFLCVQPLLTFAAGQPYDAAKFDQLLKDGKPVVIHVHAPWCPTCKAQDPILNGIFSNADYKNIALIEVDYDTQKDFKKTYHVSAQSTIIAFKGGKEVGRSTGDTKAETVVELVKKSL
jgi:thioredoxin 1